MAYLEQKKLEEMGFASLGRNVRISEKASLYEIHKMHLGDNCRIDDFCVISGNISLGQNVYVGPFCLLAGGSPGIKMEDFSTLAYRVTVFSQSDDYSGESMTNPTVPSAFKLEKKEPVYIGRHCIVGAGSIIFPGVTLAEGCSVGSASLVLKSTEPWSIMVGSPARKLRCRKRDLLDLEKRYLSSQIQ